MSDLIFKILGSSAISKFDVGTVFEDSNDTSTTSLSNTFRNAVFHTFSDKFGNLCICTEVGIYRCVGNDINQTELISNQFLTQVVYNATSNSYIGTSGADRYSVVKSTDLITWVEIFSSSSLTFTDNYPFIPYVGIRQSNDVVFITFAESLHVERMNSTATAFTRVNFVPTNSFIQSQIFSKYEILGIEYENATNTHYAITNRGISFKSTNNGVSWSKAFTNWPNHIVSSKVWLRRIQKFIGFELLNPESPLAFYRESADPNLLTPEYIAGSDTTGVPGYLDLLTGNPLSFGDSNDTGTVIMLGFKNSNAILISTNAGSTWSLRTFSSQVQGIVFTSVNSFLVFQSDRISRTTNNGSSWTTALSSINIANAQIGLRTNPAGSVIQSIVVGSRSTAVNAIYYSTDEGVSWQTYNSPWGAGGIVSLCWDGSRFVASVVNSPNFWISTDGISWSNTNNPIPGSTPGINYYAESIIFRNSKYFVFSNTFISTEPSSFPSISYSSSLTSFTQIPSVSRTLRTPIIHAGLDIIYYDHNRRNLVSTINTSSNSFSESSFALYFNSPYEDQSEPSYRLTCQDLDNFYVFIAKNLRYSIYKIARSSISNFNPSLWQDIMPDYNLAYVIQILSKYNEIYARQEVTNILYKYDNVTQTLIALTSDSISEAFTGRNVGASFTDVSNKIYSGGEDRTERYSLDYNSPMQGTNAGYTSGGFPGDINTIDRFPFSTSFNTATDIGDLSEGRSNTSGNSSDTDGYASGGGIVGSTKIDKFPFSTPFMTSTYIGDLSQSEEGLAGQSSNTHGYLTGSRGGTNKIERFPFSTPFTVNGDIGDLSTIRFYAAGQSSSTNGYTSGGVKLFPTAYLNRIDRFPFSTPFTTATNIGNLNSNIAYVSGQSSITDGYVSGGYSPTSEGYSPAYRNTIDRFPFSTPFVYATDVGDLSQRRSNAAGQSSVTDGYVSGGSVGPSATVTNRIDRFPFSTPFVTTKDTGDLYVTRSASSGQQD